MNRSTRAPFVLLPLLLLFGLLVACSRPPLPTPPPTEVDVEAVTEVPTLAPTAVSPETPPQTPESGAFIPPANDLPPGRIAFVSANGRVGTVDPDGEALRYLTPANGVFQFPAWSPTNNELAVIGNLPGISGVFTLTDEEDSDIVPLYTDTPPIYLYWKPDGTQVSFIAQHRDGLGLYLSQADGESESKLLATGQPLYWHWHPDGERTLTHRGSEPLAYFDTAGNEDALDIGRGIFQTPGVSASGQFVAYSERENRDQFLTVRDESTAEVLFSEAHEGIAALTWSPTADTLAYISPTDPRASFFGPLRLYSADNNESRTAVADDVLAFFWSPDGRYIAYISLAQGSQQASAKPDSRTAKPAQQRQVRATLFVLDVENGSQRPLYNYVLPPLFVSQFLPFFDQYALSHRLWSPDSRYLVVPVRGEEDVTRIAVIPRDGSPPAFVAEGVAAFWSQQ